jgi:hypothetical protein
MMRFLRNWFCNPRGRAAATPSARRHWTVCLQVETLEERAVPAVMNLTGYNFALPGATLHITSENVATGTFHGVLLDFNSAINVPVNGNLAPLANHWDTMDFHGFGVKGFEMETIQFNGDLHEAVFPLMMGVLTEKYHAGLLQLTRMERVESYGHPSAPIFWLAEPSSVLTDGDNTALAAALANSGIFVPHGIPASEVEQYAFRLGNLQPPPPTDAPPYHVAVSAAHHFDLPPEWVDEQWLLNHGPN